MRDVKIVNSRGECVGIVRAIRQQRSETGELRTVFPKFDLGKQSRQIDRPIRTVYATIDRNGEQTALSIPSRNGIQSLVKPMRFWLDWRR